MTAEEELDEALDGEVVVASVAGPVVRDAKSFAEVLAEHQAAEDQARDAARAYAAGELDAEEVTGVAVGEGGSLGEEPHDADGCHEGGRPHLGPCCSSEAGHEADLDDVDTWAF